MKRSNLFVLLILLSFALKSCATIDELFSEATGIMLTNKNALCVITQVIIIDNKTGTISKAYNNYTGKEKFAGIIVLYPQIGTYNVTVVDSWNTSYTLTDVSVIDGHMTHLIWSSSEIKYEASDEK